MAPLYLRYKMKIRAWRKMIDFKTLEKVNTIKLAVKIIFSKLTQGESISFSSFVVAAAYGAAVEVIKANPDFPRETTTDAVKIIEQQQKDQD